LLNISGVPMVRGLQVVSTACRPRLLCFAVYLRHLAEICAPQFRSLRLELPLKLAHPGLVSISRGTERLHLVAGVDHADDLGARNAKNLLGKLLSYVDFPTADCKFSEQVIYM
jgi:hypothetical protein